MIRLRMHWDLMSTKVMSVLYLCASMVAVSRSDIQFGNCFLTHVVCRSVVMPGKGKGGMLSRSESQVALSLRGWRD